MNLFFLLSGWRNCDSKRVVLLMPMWSPNHLDHPIRIFSTNRSRCALGESQLRYEIPTGKKKNVLKRPWHQVQVRYKQPSIRGLDQSLTPVSFNLNICSLFPLDSQLKSNLLFFTSSLLHLQSSLSELIQKPSSSPSLLLLTSLPLRVGKPLLVLFLLARMLQVMG